MLKRKRFILMLLFSFLAHLAIAGSVLYAPLRFSGNDRIIGTEKVIWGIVQDQVAGSSKQVAEEDRKSEGGSKKSEVKSKILTALRGTKGDENVIPPEAGIQNDDIDLDFHFRGNDVMERVFSSEPHTSLRLTKDEENPLSLRERDRLALSKVEGMRVGLFSSESIGSGQEREIDGGNDPEVLYSHQETFQTGMDGGCNESNHCTDTWASDNLTSGVDKVIAHSRESGRNPLRGILGEVRREIERHKYYPPFARKNGIEGTVYINFHIGSDGRPGSISIGRSSGFKILDDSAIKTLKDIRQFPTLPEEMRGLDITVPIAYRLTEEKN